MVIAPKMGVTAIAGRCFEFGLHYRPWPRSVNSLPPRVRILQFRLRAGACRALPSRRKVSPMSRELAQSDPRLAERLTALETVVTHLERTIHDLDEAIRARNKQLDLVDRKLAQLGLEVGALREGPPEVRTPEDEKPPHY